MVGDGRMLDGDEYLKATARPAVALVSEATLATLGVPVGSQVTLGSASGSVTLPVAVADLPDDVAWAPTTSVWPAGAGERIRISPVQGGQ
jgi:NADH-quinone oxidoreductase subunit G